MAGDWGRRLGALLGVIVALFIIGGTPAWAGGPDNSDCANAPDPEMTGRGFTGAIDPPSSNSTPHSVYAEYSYAGQVWNLYDNVDDTLGVCFDPGGTIENWLGNQMFNVDKVITAGANATHHAINDGGLTDQVDSFVGQAAKKAYSGIGAPFIPLALIIMGIIIMRHTLSGDNRQVIGAGGRTLAMLFVASMALSPLLYTTFADQMLFGGVRDAQNKVLGALYGQPKDGTPADIPPTNLEDKVVYRNWLRGEFGDENDPMAKKFGRMLLDGQAYTVNETNSAAVHDKKVKDAKHKRFIHVASEMHDKGDYQSFTGRSGRVGAGAIAMVQGLTISLFTLGANASVLLAQLLLRAMVLFSPLIGFACLLPGRARTYARAALTFMAIGFIMTVTTIFYTYVIGLIQNAGMPIGLELLCTTALTAFVWYFARPFKRLKDMTSSMSEATGVSKHSGSMTQTMQKMWLYRAMRRKDQPTSSEDEPGRWWNQQGPEATGTPDGGTDRRRDPVQGQAMRAEGRPVYRPEPQPHAGALPAGSSGRGPEGPSPSASMPGGRIPETSGPGGAGAAVVPPVPLRGEAVRGDAVRAEAFREPALSRFDQRYALPAAPVNALEAAANDARAKKNDFVVPSQILPPEGSAPPQPAPRNADGAYVITRFYKPSDDPMRPSELPSAASSPASGAVRQPQVTRGPSDPAAPQSGRPESRPAAPAAARPAVTGPAAPQQPAARPVSPPLHQSQPLSLPPGTARKDSPPPEPVRPESAVRPFRPARRETKE